jgi:dihydrofolate reductase
MGAVVVSEFITLDGVYQDPGGAGELDRGGWALQFDRGPEGNKFKFDEVMAAEVLLLGRTTYEGFANAWPTMADDSGFAAKMNSMPKYVVSSTLRQASWDNSTIISGNIPDAVRTLKQRVEGDILVNGSGQLVSTLAQHDLVDEYRFMMYPVILGKGKPFFSAAAQSHKLRLTESRKAGDTVILVFHPIRT